MIAAPTVGRRMTAVAQHETDDDEAAGLIPTTSRDKNAVDPEDEFPSRNKRDARGVKVSKQRTSSTSDARNNVIKYGSLLLLVGQVRFDDRWTV